MTSPREDFLIAMFEDDYELVEGLREEKRGFNWAAVWGAILGIAISGIFWAGIILAWLYRKGWL